MVEEVCKRMEGKQETCFALLLSSKMPCLEAHELISAGFGKFAACGGGGGGGGGAAVAAAPAGGDAGGAAKEEKKAVEEEGEEDMEFDLFG